MRGSHEHAGSRMGAARDTVYGRDTHPLNVYSSIDAGFISIEKPGRLGGI
jgi:hypothetical protein